MTRAMSNSDCNHPMIGPNEPLVQMNCLRGSLWSSEHWFEINCRSSHTQDIFTVICRVENIQDPLIVRQIFPWKYSSMKRALKWYGRRLNRIVSKSMARSLFWRVGGGEPVPAWPTAKQRSRPAVFAIFWWYILCCVRYPWCIRYFLCCVCILCNPECWYLMLSIIFGGGAVRCCVLRAKVYSVPPIYIKLLRTEVFFRAVGQNMGKASGLLDIRIPSRNYLLFWTLLPSNFWTSDKSREKSVLRCAS